MNSRKRPSFYFIFAGNTIKIINAAVLQKINAVILFLQAIRLKNKSLIFYD